MCSKFCRQGHGLLCLCEGNSVAEVPSCQLFRTEVILGGLWCPSFILPSLLIYAACCEDQRRISNCRGSCIVFTRILDTLVGSYFVAHLYLLKLRKQIPNVCLLHMLRTESPLLGLALSNTILFPQPWEDCCHFQLLFAMKTMAPG